VVSSTYESVLWFILDDEYEYDYDLYDDMFYGDDDAGWNV